LEDVVQNKSGAATILSIPVTVVGDLTLTNGIINTTSTNLLTLADDATSTSGNEGSYIDGPRKKVGDDAFVFPLGNGSVWARLGISAPSLATDGFTAQYFDSPYSNITSLASSPTPILTNLSGVEYWTCDRTDGTSTVTVELFWEDASRSDISNYADVVVAHWNGTAWENQGQTAVTASDPGSVTSSPQNSFSPYTIGSINGSNGLPIELLGFHATLNAKRQVKLNWETATEINNNYFTVERSKDGISFESVNIVKGAGNSLIKKSYESTDGKPYTGISYYRLKQTDYNGAYSYSGIRTINNNLVEGTMEVFPNPNSGDFFNISISKESSSVLVVLYNPLGEEVFSKIIISDGQPVLIAVDTENKLPAGIYSVIATSDNEIYRRKMIIR